MHCIAGMRTRHDMTQRGPGDTLPSLKGTANMWESGKTFPESLFYNNASWTFLDRNIKLPISSAAVGERIFIVNDRQFIIKVSQTFFAYIECLEIMHQAKSVLNVFRELSVQFFNLTERIYSGIKPSVGPPVINRNHVWLAMTWLRWR